MSFASTPRIASHRSERAPPKVDHDEPSKRAIVS